MAETPSAAMPRELVLASAGTGKTFRISTRIIALLALGARPEGIFASTFTRKAAGEILDRVLAKLADAALDPGEAAELARHTSLPGLPETPPAPAYWLSLLDRLVRDLHRVNIGTLDSFFVRAATTFADDLDLPPGWSIADAPVMDRVRAEALQQVLASADTGAIVELVRAVSGSDAGRSVHGGMIARAMDLLDLHHALDPEASDPWAGLEPALGDPPGDVEAARDRIASALSSAQAPLTGKGEPHQGYAKGLQAAAEMLRAGDWDALVASKLCASACEEGGLFYGKPISDEVRALFTEACRLGRWVVGRRLVAQGRAMGRLATMLAAAVAARQREMGAYEFGDLTRMIGGPDPIADRPDLYYRLDARAQHILLDEFQDTSLVQWEAMEPLLEELLSGYLDERAAVVVADPKQSIYAWRGGEPLLVEHVGRALGLERSGMHRSYRSSEVVLRAVNRIFRDLAANPVFGADAEAREVAAEWAAAFEDHDHARDLPGHVRVVVGPEDEGTGSDRPLLCRRAAALVAELRSAAPGRSIGVLTRRNATVARMMMELGRLGVAASEEGGNPLTDSKAVASLLALLRMSEHPGDLVSRYHVARTPVGVAVGFTDHGDDAAANRLAHHTRRRLVRDGYGPTLASLAARLRDACSPRERRRLDQLAELGFRYDDRATLRVSDFLRLVEAERVEDPTSADVRVMTIHQAKGLEFDVVVLPELDFDLERAQPAPLAYRPTPTARVTRAFPYVAKGLRGLFDDVPELRTALRDARAGRLRDGLSGLYVALTRARHSLHVVVKPDGPKGMGGSCTAAAIVRHALDAAGPAAEGDVLFEIGDPHWHQAAPPPAADAGDGRPRVEVPVRLREAGARTRGFARRAPSDLAAGSKVDLKLAMNLDSAAAVEGTIAHGWLELVGWLEDGLPTEDALMAAARAIDPRIPADRLAALRERWGRWTASDPVRRALSRASYGEGAALEREVRFIHRDGDAVLEGAIDRLVLLRQDGRVTGAVILDYKTDRVDPSDAGALAAKAETYRPQLHAYRRAVAGWYRIPAETISCRLVVLEAGAVVEV